MDAAQLYNGDCMEAMQEIPDHSVDMVLCDPPYGLTHSKWDFVLPLDEMWKHYGRIAKENAAIVLFSQQPFTTTLIGSNPKHFRYEWIWQKSNVTGFLNANRMPLKTHENILVFYAKLPTYNPQFTEGKPYRTRRTGTPEAYNCFERIETVSDGKRYPKDVLSFPNSGERESHPTQKPVALLEYLIRTYTNEGETVLDSCMGSGSTGVAAANAGRRFIGIELDRDYFETARRRIREAQSASEP